MQITSKRSTHRPWYRETAMMIVIAVLGSTFVSGAIMLTVALQVDDPLVISDGEYQRLRDDFRATQARERDDD